MKIVFLLYTGFLFSAAPVVHVHFAQLYFKKHKPSYSSQERAAFLIGTLFPDIRYLARIERKKTHEKNVALKQVFETKDPFTAGKLFHSYVDIQREKIAQRAKIYDHMNAAYPKHRKTTFLKVVEDELCYKKMNAKEAIEALKSFDKAEETFGISFFKIRAWHSYLRSYLEQSPLDLFSMRMRTKRGYFTMGLRDVAELTNFIKHGIEDKTIRAYADKLFTDFEKNLVII